MSAQLAEAVRRARALARERARVEQALAESNNG